MAFTERPEVFVVRTAVGDTCTATLPSRSTLMSRFSTTTSTIQSTPAS